MRATNATSGGTIHGDILIWSTELPDWQQDAVRRIVENGSLSADDIDELTAACRVAAGLQEDKIPELVPFASEHLPNRTDSASQISLRSVSKAKNVNAIDPEQSLAFAATGLTVVFGYNGSGKSGYGRILRRACRARSKGKAILPNVRAPAPGLPASAIITYCQDGVEKSPEQWVDEQRSIEALRAVSFFDSDCAFQHVGSKNDIAFTPFGLDVLPALGSACRTIQGRLDAEKKDLEGKSPQFLKSSHAVGKTKVGFLLRSLKAETNIEVLTALASLNTAELQRAKDIPGLLAADPQKQATELQTRAGRVESLRLMLEKSVKSLSDGAISYIKGLASIYATRAKTAQVAARLDFADAPLSSIGEPVWRQLWEAARRYSEIAFPDRSFPVTEIDDAVCVLCQQPLTNDAKDRLIRFEKFILDDSAQEARTAKENLRKAVEAVRELGLSDAVVHEQLKDLKACDTELHQSVRQLLATLIRRMRAITQADLSEQWDFTPQGILEDVLESLTALVASTKQRADDIAKTSDVEERQRLENELAELKAREWLATVVGDVREYIERLAQIKKLENAAKETRTNGITAKSKELAKKYVTDQLRDAFANEIKKMQQGVRRLNVELVETSGEFGSSYYKVQLVGASKIDPSTVVSEGEHRCIALAGFLSELATESCKSAVIFDDPVTSLDHQWRECFARRLVEEAAYRQVIVFTHDIVFLHDLWAGSELNNVPIELRRVQSNRDHSGCVDDGLPWIAQKTLPRIDDLEKRAKATRRDFDDHNDDQYEREIYLVYSELRATVERAVEEKLFLGIVTRHQDYIALGNLRKVTAVTIDHCERLQKLFKRCCDITSAHDRASLRSFGVPTTDDALDDIAELKAIVDDVKDKQKLVS